MKMSIVLAAVSTAVLMPVFAGTTTESDDKDLSSPMTVNVASSDVKIWTGTVTGSAKLTKTGTGTLVLKHDNSETFSGENIKVKDTTFFSSWGWTLVMNCVTNALVDNAKVICGRVINYDGIDICRAKDVVLRNSFVRCQDDALTPK